MLYFAPLLSVLCFALSFPVLLLLLFFPVLNFALFVSCALLCFFPVLCSALFLSPCLLLLCFFSVSACQTRWRRKLLGSKKKPTKTSKDSMDRMERSDAERQLLARQQARAAARAQAALLQARQAVSETSKPKRKLKTQLIACFCTL